MQNGENRLGHMTRVQGYCLPGNHDLTKSTCRLW